MLYRSLIMLAAIASFPAFGAPPWRSARSERFQVYAQSNGPQALAILRHFEQLRAFFLQQSGWKTSGQFPVRVIVFASPQEYEPYRLQAMADAYYVGAGDQDYIVLASADPRDYGIAAHEYVHLILKTSNQQAPSWLQEGLAELYSTLKLGDRETELGGPLPGRLAALRGEWMPLDTLVAWSDASLRTEGRAATDLFYAESWALTGMLVLSPAYAPDFQSFLAAARDGSSSLEALTKIYGKTPDAIARDLREWVKQRAPRTVQLPAVPPEAVIADVSDLSDLASRELLAHLLLVAGRFDRAESAISALSQDEPDSADVSAALAILALHRGDFSAARSAWTRALALNIADAALCSRYAAMADRAGMSPEDIRPALERVVALRPDLDDAHYRLALLEKNAGHFEAALQQFQAMRTVPEPRAFSYWLSLADLFNETGRRMEAQSAAERAAAHASNPAERASADRERFLARTDPGVRFTRDAEGKLQLQATRVPHEATEWNPFVEPDDDLHRIQGDLREIDCDGNATIVRIATAGEFVILEIPDLRHVQMRHAPEEFVCGPQTDMRVLVDYARHPNGRSEGVVRGMDFR